jgi:hypothetical protein
MGKKIHNFNVIRMPMLKPKTQTPTVIDTDAPLASQIPGQPLQAVGMINLNHPPQ